MSEWVALLLALVSAGLWHQRTHRSGRSRAWLTGGSVSAAVSCVAAGAADPNPVTPWVFGLAAWSMGFAGFVLARPYAPRRADRVLGVLTVAAIGASASWWLGGFS
ncbi:MAG: hypothetical protein AAF799_47975 [Myxococcota bacterium]